METPISLPSTPIIGNTTTSIYRNTPSTTRSHNRSLTPAAVGLRRRQRTYQFHPLPAIGRSDIQPPPPLRATRSPQSRTELLSPQSHSAATAKLSSATRNSVTNHLPQPPLNRTLQQQHQPQPPQLVFQPWRRLNSSINRSAVTPRRHKQQEGNSAKRIEAQKTLEAKLINCATSSATPALWIHVIHHVCSLEPHLFRQLRHWPPRHQHHHVIAYCHVSYHIIWGPSVINSTAKSWSVNNSTFQFVDFTSLVLHLVFEIIINISFVPKKKEREKRKKKKSHLAFFC